jgi:hypothetical protein
MSLWRGFSFTSRVTEHVDEQDFEGQHNEFGKDVGIEILLARPEPSHVALWQNHDQFWVSCLMRFAKQTVDGESVRHTHQAERLTQCRLPSVTCCKPRKFMMKKCRSSRPDAQEKELDVLRHGHVLMPGIHHPIANETQLSLCPYKWTGTKASRSATCLQSQN